MEDSDYGDLEMDWSIPSGQYTGICCTPSYQLTHFSSPRNLGLNLCALSPIMFEESTLDQLWGDANPIKPAMGTINCKELSTLKNQNGLKSLSWKVKEIVRIYGASNYKEVADNLLTNFETPISDIPLKDEKNIRRRVYDVLNVLVAAKVISKSGRKVMPAELQPPDGEDLLKEKRKSSMELKIILIL